MKALLKEESQLATRLSDMKEHQFAIVLDGEWEGNIVYRPYNDSCLFAVDLTNGHYWSNTKGNNPKVRILQAGEVIELTE